jgi:hypothetical protein
MLIEGIAAGVVVAVIVAVLFTRRVSQDDVHSVEGYHRSLHTLEHINAHPATPTREAKPGTPLSQAYGTGAVRVRGSPAVRVTEQPPSIVPADPPPVDEPEGPLKFDGVGQASVVPPEYSGGRRDKAMSSMNRRPRRLAAPALAVTAVTVLIVVLVVTGSHSVPPTHHKGTASIGRHKGETSKPRHHKNVGATPTTTTTTLPTVSTPVSSSANGATYDVGPTSFTLVLSATTGACWVDATSTSSGVNLFTGTLSPGEQQSLAASGPVTIMVGAPGVFAATVDGTAVSLPSSYQTPFTLKFVSSG